MTNKRSLKIYFIWAAWERLRGLNYNIPPMGILRIAGATPPIHSIQFTDEMVSPVDSDSDADIVAISFLTPAADRAYEIAAFFKNRGKYIVFGGAHTTILPEDARKHADTIFVGEADQLWQQFLHDYQKGNPQSIYSHTVFPELKGLPSIRREVLVKYKYPYENPIETGVESMELSRGCTANCAFCMVPRTQGTQFRNLPIEDIIRDYGEIAHSPGMIFFTDNNLLGNWQQTEKALNALITYGKDWFGLLAPEDAAKDPEKLDLMIRSGLCGVYGTVKAITGREKSSTLNLRKERLQRLKDLGVTIIATFALGWDNHDSDVFDRTVDFCLESQLAVPEFIINTPFPGSRQYQQYQSENRICTYDWQKYNGNHAVYQPRLMSMEALEEGYRRCNDRFYAEMDRDALLFDELKYRAFESMIRARKRQLDREQ